MNSERTGCSKYLGPLRGFIGYFERARVTTGYGLSRVEFLSPIENQNLYEHLLGYMYRARVELAMEADVAPQVPPGLYTSAEEFRMTAFEDCRTTFLENRVKDERYLTILPSTIDYTDASPILFEYEHAETSIGDGERITITLGQQEHTDELVKGSTVGSVTFLKITDGEITKYAMCIQK